MTSPANSVSAPHRSCRDPYRPYSPMWIPIAYITFFLVYFLFAIIIEGDDLLGPVGWIEWLNARLPLGLIPSPDSPVLRIIFNIFSPAVLLHVLVPAGIAYWIAGRATASFLQNFYGFKDLAAAKGFLASLRTGVGSVGTPPATIKRPPLPVMIGLFLSPVIFFGILAIFVVIITNLRSPIASLPQFYNLILTLLLFVLWGALIVFALLITKDYQERAISVSRRLPLISGGLLSAYILVLIILLFFPLFWMAVIYLVLTVFNIQPQSIFLVLMFVFSIFFIGEIVFLFLLPRPKATSPVKQETNGENQSSLPNYSTLGPRSIVISEGHQAAVTESNARFCRVLGPGTHQLNAYEYIYSQLDLRQHEREEEKVYNTRDGIRVQIKTSVTFRIASSDELLENNAEATASRPNTTRPTNKRLYPFGERAVQQAAYTKTVLNPTGSRLNDWQSLPLQFAQSQLKKQIARYRYDELFNPDSAEAHLEPHPHLQEMVMKNTQKILNQNRTGIYLLECRLGPINAIDKDIINEHVQNLRSGWNRQSELRNVTSQTQTLVQRTNIRQEAERVLIQAIVQGINNAEEKLGPHVSEQIVSLRTIETMERMSQISPYVKHTVLKELLARVYKEIEIVEGD